MSLALKIGELAERTGCLVETVRFYERSGMLPPPERATNNYRSYNEGHVDRLVFIRHCRALDMTLDEIRVLLDFRERPDGDCCGVNELLDKHISHIVERIATLTSLESQLRVLRGQCQSTETIKDCGIIQALGEPAVRESEAPH